MTGEELVEVMCYEVKKHWARNGGPRQQVLYNHMTKTAQVLASSSSDPAIHNTAHIESILAQVQ
jgi:hypothetical protein